MYSTGIAYLLWLLSGFGALGLHRFYLGRFGTGLLYLFTGGIFGIGGIFDLFYIPTMVREENLRLQYRGAIHGNSETMRSPWENIFTGDFSDAFRPKPQESIEKVILKTAKENEGIVSPGEVALRSDISLDEAKSYLEKLVKEGYADIRVKKTGMIVYVFPEFLSERRRSELEDF